MRGEHKIHWLVLCEQATTEQDPKKFMELIRQINQALEAKERRLNDEASGATSASAAESTT
jgi:hypothetical protein